MRSARSRIPITHARLLELLHYSHETGKFTWLQCLYRPTLVGTEAGYVNGDGYRILGIDGKMYRANRVAVFYVTGKWPDPEAHVDHKFADRDDNRWSEIREISKRGNTENLRRPHKDNKSGFQGVVKRRLRYWACIGVNYKVRWIGSCASPEEAHAAYVEAKRELHEGCTL